MTNDELNKVKREVNLKDFARERYGIESNARGMAHCPFHPPDDCESFQFWRGDDGIFRYRDQHDGKVGTIVDFIMNKDGKPLRETFLFIESHFFGRSGTKRADSEKPKIYEYKNEQGQPLFRKGKRTGKKYWLEHYEDGQWKKGRGILETVPYNLHERAGKRLAIVCEGEKDAETVNRVVKSAGMGHWVTSAMFGKASWPESINRHFEGLESVVFIYDVGAEMYATEWAGVLKAHYPDMAISVARVPLENIEEDITDYLDRIGGEEANEEKARALQQLIAAALEVEGVTDSSGDGKPSSELGERANA